MRVSLITAFFVLLASAPASHAGADTPDLGPAAREAKKSPLSQTLAQRGEGKRGRRGGGGSGRTREELVRQGLFGTGVRPIYPNEARCLEVKSFFADRTRYDGSPRVPWANHGYHGGIDISADEGTPLVAIAAGEVVHKFTGGRLVGHQIYLRHAPADTGLPIWLYSKYKHFRQLPDLRIGERVEMGQVIGESGKTGTTGGYFGDEGYPHLHMSTYAGRTGDYTPGRRGVRIPDMQQLDPLAVYLLKDRKVFDNHAVRALPDDKKTVRIPYKTTDGRIVPAGTRLIWPFMCEPK